MSIDLGGIAPSRKNLKKPIQFNLMVVGESGLGKSTFIKNVLEYSNVKYLPEESSNNIVLEEIESKMEMFIQKSVVEIDLIGAKMRLTITETPGYGDMLNNAYCIKPIIDYIDQQLNTHFYAELGIHRRELQDTRIHCLLFFIEPLGRRLKKLDIDLLLSICKKVNIVPVLAKADSYTDSELIKTKRRILEEFANYKIDIYEPPVTDTEDDPKFVNINNQIKKLIPFANTGATGIIEIAGKRMRGRSYPWGYVNIDNESTCDFPILRLMLLRTHVNDLRDVTDEVLYENYRISKISNKYKDSANGKNKLEKQPRINSSKNSTFDEGSTPPGSIV